MKSKLLVTFLLGLFFAPRSLWAQGLFQGIGIPATVAGTGINSFNAKLSWQNSLNAFLKGTSVPVINAVSGGLVAQPITDPRVTSKTIHLSEGYSSAFSNSSQFGQTGSTKIRIRVTD